MAEEKIEAEMRCIRQPKPVPLVRWLLKNRLVTSIGPGADGIALLVPTKPLNLLGHRVLYIEAWGGEETSSGQVIVRWPFAMSAGTKLTFVAVMLAGLQQEIGPIVERRLPKAWIPGDSKDHLFMQVTEVICTDLRQGD